MIDQQNTPGARARRPRQQTGPEAITPEVSAQYLPPMSVEAEQAVIGAMLISPLAIEKAAELLKPEDFYRENHKLLFESIVAISARSEPVDLVTIQEELQNRGALEQAGGIGYITSLLGMLTPVSHVEHHAKIVDEKAILRRLIDAAMQIIGLARNPEPDQDVASVLDQAEKLIFGVSQRKSNQSFSPLSPLLRVRSRGRAQRNENEGFGSGDRHYRVRLYNGWTSKDGPRDFGGQTFDGKNIVCSEHCAACRYS
jgi:replicative DNA helicase